MKPSFFGIALTLQATSCVVETTRPNPGHCWNAQGDATCAIFADDAPFCSRDTEPCNHVVPLGCLEFRPELDECYSPCGQGASILEDDSCVPGDPDPDPGSASMVDLAASLPDPQTCGECPAELPFCWAGQCVACTADEDCEGICNGDHECQACRRQDQCPGGAGCDRVTGACLPSDRVLHIGPNQHLETFADALVDLDGGSGTLIVHSTPGGYLESVEVIPGQTLVVRGDPDGAAPIIVDADGNSCVSAGYYGFGVSGRLFLDYVQLFGNGGVRVIDGGEAYVERTRIRAGTCRAALCLGGHLQITNSMLVGSETNLDGDAVVIPGPDPCTVSISYSSIFSFHESAVACEEAAVLPGSSIRKSLLYAVENVPLACPPNLVSSSGIIADDSSWFQNPLGGDLHLSPFADLPMLTDFMIGDSLFDIDGDPRFLNDNAGADVPAP